MNYWICSTKPLHQWLILKPLVFLSALLASALTYSADFGVANWGMTATEIKQLETRSNLTPFGEADYLIYSVNINGIDTARIVYQFSDNRLTKGRFIFKPQNRLDFARALRQYQTIVSLMTSQYGPASMNQQLHRAPDNALQSNAPMVNELAADRLILKTQWQTDASVMIHQLAWNNNEPHHQIHYIPARSITTMATEPAQPLQSF
ncbi:hypothetical protein [Reinekea marinisedimentorum]|uniref:Uncharacterized protein n=1 Tax=Reinekea marinisedimentorum TaxID=230495 RepID=A0A4R3IB05_9GAMM|nr:hypothetical protein [Reinekea marinisedimentorum]TCS42431.1 hypothetical protein BCF53_10392 [Reinekea marinisedimentorum]